MLDGVVMGWCFRGLGGGRRKGDGGNPSDWSGDYACFEGVVWEVGGGFSGLVEHLGLGIGDVRGLDVVVSRIDAACGRLRSPGTVHRSPEDPHFTMFALTPPILSPHTPSLSRVELPTSRGEASITSSYRYMV